jgi:putative transposase
VIDTVREFLKEHKLLLGITIRSTGPRKWVKHRRIEAKHPLDYLSHDIKYVYVEGEKRNYLLYSILDVYSRKILYSLFQRSIRKADVVRAFLYIQRVYGLKGVKIRNDNGSQFVSHLVKDFLRNQQAEQEFTHVATPVTLAQTLDS